MADTTTQGSGEHPKGRQAMDALRRELHREGVPTQKAENLARAAALRHDRREGR